MATETEVSLAGLAAHLKGLSFSRVVTWLVDHHTWSPAVANYCGISTVRGIRNYHMNVRGWSDNGYHITVGPDGKVFLCRPMRRSGGHCIARNADSIGVSIIGNYDAGRDTFWGSAGHKAYVSVLALLAARFRIDPATRMGPHARWDPKTCPGTSITQQWGRLVQEVRAAMVNEISSPSLKVFMGDGTAVECRPRLENGVTRCDLRPVAQRLDAEVDIEQWPIIVLRTD